MKDKVLKIARYILSLAVAAVFVWLVVRKIDWTGFADDIKETRWLYIALFALISILALIFRTLRWDALLKPLGSRNRLIDIWDATNVGNLANIALPGSGELLRSGFVARKGPSFDKTFGTIFMERLWDILAILILIVAALAMKWDSFTEFLSKNSTDTTPALGSPVIISAAAALVILGSVLIYLSFRNEERYPVCAKITKALRGLITGAGSFFKMKNKPYFILQTALVWLMYVLMSWCCFKAIPELSHLTMADALLLSAIGNLASVIPVPSGMGPYHYLVSLALSSLYGCSGETGLLFAVLNHETHAILILAIGAASYIRFTISKS